MRYVTAAEMRQIDKAAIEAHGIPAQRLMENAGRAVAEEVKKITAKGLATVFCGYGNNGGDGLVAARYLVKRGYSVDIFFVGEPRSFSPESNANLEKLLSLKVTPKFISKKSQLEKVRKPAVIIDAIFGVGLKGSLDDFYIGLIDVMNNMGAPIVAVDIPSGLDADTGMPLGRAIKAAVTVTFGYPKFGFKNPEAKKYTGRVIVADIGLPSTAALPQGHGHAGGGKSIRLRTGKKGVLSPGHPWILKHQILGVDPSIRPGDIIFLQNAKNEFVGRGYYNPRSDISIRIMTFKDEAIDASFFENRIDAAFKRRQGLLNKTNAYRAVFSEGDGLPGLIVDIYDDTAVFQTLTLGMDRFKALIADVIKNIAKPRYIYEKSVSPFRKIEGLKDEKRWWGAEGKTIIEIFEGSARFLVDIENGHKTGFYLDQRNSRLAMQGISRQKAVLDLFCYTGPFSISACLAGAKKVIGVDIKEQCLELARKNAELNDVSERAEFIKEDAFKFLDSSYNSGAKYDIIIIDPPSFIKTRHSLVSASKGYRRLNTIAMKMLTEGGILATFSCSYNMPNELFSEIVKEAAMEAGRKTRILKRCHQAEDHPIARAIPETEYLKGYFLKMESV